MQNKCVWSYKDEVSVILALLGSCYFSSDLHSLCVLVSHKWPLALEHPMPLGGQNICQCGQSYETCIISQGMANSSLIDKERGKIPTVMITDKTVYPIICVKKYSALVKMFFFRLSTTVYPLTFYHLSGVSHGGSRQTKLNWMSLFPAMFSISS